MLNILADAMLVATGQSPILRQQDHTHTRRPVRETDTRKSWLRLVGLRF